MAYKFAENAELFCKFEHFWSAILQFHHCNVSSHIKVILDTLVSVAPKSVTLHQNLLHDWHFIIFSFHFGDYDYIAISTYLYREWENSWWVVYQLCRIKEPYKCDNSFFKKNGAPLSEEDRELVMSGLEWDEIIWGN